MIKLMSFYISSENTCIMLDITKSLEFINNIKELQAYFNMNTLNKVKVQLLNKK